MHRQWRRRALRAWRRDDGATALEFAIVFPIFGLLVFGMIKFGITLSHYLQLTDGVRIAARQLSVGRGSATAYTLGTNALRHGAPNLNFSDISYAATVNGTACDSDSSCATAFANTAGESATFTASYACDLQVLMLNIAPGCQISAATTVLIE